MGLAERVRVAVILGRKINGLGVWFDCWAWTIVNRTECEVIVFVFDGGKTVKDDYFLNVGKESNEPGINYLVITWTSYNEWRSWVTDFPMENKHVGRSYGKILCNKCGEGNGSRAWGAVIWSCKNKNAGANFSKKKEQGVWQVKSVWARKGKGHLRRIVPRFDLLYPNPVLRCHSWAQMRRGSSRKRVVRKFFLKKREMGVQTRYHNQKRETGN